MLRAGSLRFPILATFLLFFSAFPLSSQGKERSPEEISHFVPFHAQHNPGEIYRDINGVVLGEKRRVLAEGPNGELPLNSSSLILAAKRTYRQDPLNDFKKYTGGWNISNRHYWASVGFTAVPFFLAALIWFAIFGLCLLFICICYCCCAREQYGYSRLAYALSLILLIVFTVAAIVGCIILYVGQGKFHSSTINTLGYVVNQANTTAGSLRNVSGYLAAAKQISVAQFLLPGNVQSDIDGIMNRINSSASELATKTSENKDGIDNLIETV
ncbi:unnamed protein product [Cuscuta campestris]|uniref:Transmembrane protein n=1 Tax=Cuscuta campestris TaxID=132261 RepID=A0A484M867_9ASTE|nr:unnamed protein product [Cuscuta campestris]